MESGSKISSIITDYGSVMARKCMFVRFYILSKKVTEPSQSKIHCVFGKRFKNTFRVLLNLNVYVGISGWDY